MGPLNDMICFISALTVDIKLTFCCGTCDMQGSFWPQIFVREKIPFGKKQLEIFKFSEIFFFARSDKLSVIFFFFFFCKGQILYQNSMYKYYYCLFCNVL